MTDSSYKDCKRKRWNREMILDFIKGKSATVEVLTPKQVQLHCPSLYGAALRHFGSWKAAIEASGLNYNDILLRHRPGFWNKATIIDQIKILPVKNSASVRKLRKSLYCAALRIFGSWGAAISAAGFDYSAIQQGWEPVDRQRLRYAKRS